MAFNRSLQESQVCGVENALCCGRSNLSASIGPIAVFRGDPTHPPRRASQHHRFCIWSPTVIKEDGECGRDLRCMHARDTSMLQRVGTGWWKEIAKNRTVQPTWQRHGQTAHQVLARIIRTPATDVKACASLSAPSPFVQTTSAGG